MNDLHPNFVCWTDYHAWLVTVTVMRAAELSLAPPAYGALHAAATRQGDDYIVPREAIEDAALLMPPDLALQFLAAVYDVDRPTSSRMLAAIRYTREIHR